jgi:hypothetical protein
MMDKRAFVFSGTAILLIIPSIILTASLISMFESGSTGVYVHLKGDKTFSLFESLEEDLGRAADIAGRRAVVAAADYRLTYGECLNSSTYSTSYGTGAIGAIKELMILGKLTSINNGVFTSDLSSASKYSDWISEFGTRASSLGFTVSVEDLQPQDIGISPINDTWFYLTIVVYSEVVDETGSFIYNGSIPRAGNMTRLISGSGIPVEIFTCDGSSGVSNQPPTSNITSHSNQSTISCGVATFSGSASDDNNVSKVDVNVNGTWYSATLSSSGAASTNWNLTWIPAVDGNFTVCSRATDNNDTAQLTDYCLDLTMSGCAVGNCSIIADPSYTPNTPNAARNVRYRILNNDPVNNVTIINMTSSWASPLPTDLVQIRAATTPIWSGCEGNDTKINSTSWIGGTNDSRIIPAGSPRVFTHNHVIPGCSGNRDMQDTNYWIAYDTDQGSCSISFYVCPTC